MCTELQAVLKEAVESPAVLMSTCQTVWCHGGSQTGNEINIVYWFGMARARISGGWL
jgi:hypothetical protein